MSAPGKHTGTAAFTSSNVSEYRALQQVLAHATTTSCSAKSIVRDALVGGVLTAYHDQQCRCVNHVFLPSSKCLPLLAELLAEGYFSPYLSTVPECTSQERLTARSEMGVASLFAAIALLFSDCFLDGAVYSPPVSPPRTARQAYEVLTPDTVLTSSASASPDSRGAGDGILSDRLGEPLPSPLELTIPQSREDSGVRRRHAGLGGTESNSVAGTSLTRQPPIASPTPFLAGPAQALTEDHATVPEAVATTSVAVDLLALHRERVLIALVLLATLNDSLHAAQMRQLLARHESVKAAEGEGDTASERTAGAAETAASDAIISALLFFKAQLLSCLCATEASYMPDNCRAWENPLVPPPAALEVTGRPGSTTEHATGSRLLRLYPRTALEDLVGEVTDLRGEHPASALTRSRDAANEHFDTVVDQLAQAYLTFAHRRQPSLSAWLAALKDTALTTTRTQLTHTPLLTLTRPVDGTPAVLLSAVFNTSSARRGKLPSLPLQPGEPFMYPISTPVQLFALDCATSPLTTILAFGTTVKLTDEQLRNEVEPYLSSQTWDGLSARERRLLDRLSRDRGELLRVLDKNAAVLARLAVWIMARSDADPEDAAAALMDRVNACVLFETPFTVAVGQYVRELLTRSAIALPVMEKWLIHCTTSAMPATSLKTVSAIADFAAVHGRWQYSDSAAQAVKQLKSQSLVKT